MIERLELRRWRSFDHVAIDFAPGTTFLVAPNGVGKTSLLLGLTWAMFGDHSNVPANTCVRVGHDSAEGTVTLTIGEAHHLTIRRTVTTSNKATVSYSDNGATIDEDHAIELLTQEFGAPIEIAARLAVIRGSGKEDGELQLREHLYDAFGVSGLRRAAATAGRLHKDAVAARKKLRSASSTQLKNREQLVELAAKLTSDLEALNTRRRLLAAAVEDATQTQQAVAAWIAHDSDLAERARAIEELLTAQSLGLEGRTLDELRRSLFAEKASIRLSMEQAQIASTEARAQSIAASSALSLLDSHDPSCPTCTRPFHGNELAAALQTQRDSLASATERIAAADATVQSLRTREAQLEALSRSADALNQPIPEPTVERPAGDVVFTAEAARDQLREHDEQSGSLNSERNSVAARLDNDDELQAAFAAERVAWRREALAQASATTLTAVAERLAQEQIEPLSQQVRWRWKALFGEDGLQLRPDGTIVRVVGDRELPWNLLSSGEQLWARLVASLLILRSSTTLPFAWLDEPLEHLDPRARRIVATDLATCTQSGRPAQMIVTTYEHTLAHQLAQDVPNTHLRHILRSGDYELPPRRRRNDTGENDAASAA
jgi:DNA repair exonuclease SbcCD ATPase subunit